MVKRVLIVDDDKDLGELLKMTFMLIAEMDVIHVSDGQSGIDKAIELKPDLILMDYKMPGMSGWESARLIRENPEVGNTPIIGYTAWASKEDIQKGLQQIGLNEILTKPVDLDVWEEKLSRYLS